MPPEPGHCQGKHTAVSKVNQQKLRPGCSALQIPHLCFLRAQTENDFSGHQQPLVGRRGQLWWLLQSDPRAPDSPPWLLSPAQKGMAGQSPNVMV